MASDSLRLTVLGGGSFFTPSFIGTMRRTPEVFADTEVRLNDLNAERVALVQAFCEKYTQAKGVPMTFVPEPDLDRALEGVHFVLATFRIGGVRSLVLDESIPPRFDYVGNETVGPGGLFMAVRTIPAVLDAAERMSRLCPDAWLLNYANPTNFVADALYRAGFTRSVGLCDGFICPPADVGVMFGLTREQVRTRHAGVNHCSWTYRAESDGRDLLQELREADPAAIEANLAKLGDRARRPRRWLEIFRAVDLFPAPAGHLEPYYFHDEILAAQKKGRTDYHTYRQDRDNKNWASLRAVLEDWNEDAANQVAKTHLGAHADLAIGVAVALATDSGAVFPVNVPHGGAVPGISPDTVLEVYSIVSRHGFEPITTPRFPDNLIAQQAHLAAVEKLTVQGIMEKRKGLIFQALVLHPFTNSIPRARALFDAMWEEERDVLGGYWDGV